MIKEIVLNSKKVPVPVPIRDLSELLGWISTTLLTGEHVVTRIRVNGSEVDLDLVANGRYSQVIPTNAKIEIRIDSPIDLTIQTVDALRNLATIIQPGLRPLAVECWGLNSKTTPKELDNVQADVDLLGDLLMNAVATIEAHQIRVEGLREFTDLIRDFGAAIAAARSNSDWKACSKLLLNKLEPGLEKLMNATILVQNELFQIKASTGGRLSEIGKPGPSSKSQFRSVLR
jgi:hypothetical protein